MTLARRLARQARPHLPQARAAARRPRARDRHRLGRLRAARGARTTAAASPRPRSRASSTSSRASACDAAGLADRVTCCSRTIATCAARYDKLVSIEMIEAVGHGSIDDVLPPLRASCSSRDGAMLLQAITIADQHYERGARLGRLHQALHLSRAAASRRSARSRAPMVARDATCASCTSRTSGRTTRRRSRVARATFARNLDECARSATPTRSCACGSSTSATARRLRRARASATCRCCW